MGKRTILEAENMSLTTAVRVLAAFQTAAAGSAASLVRITRLEISQSGSTTLGMVRGHIASRTTAGTLTMTATTPNNAVVGGSASGLSGNTAPNGGTARSGTNASVDSTGTYTEIMPFNFANLNGYLWKPDRDEEIIVPPSTLVAVRFLADPATLTGWTISLHIDENG